MDSARWIAFVGCMVLVAGMSGHLVAQLRYRSAAYEGERALLIGVARTCNLLMPLGAVLLLAGCVIGVANWL